MVLFDGILWVKWEVGSKVTANYRDVQSYSSYSLQGRKQLLQVAQPLEEELCSLVFAQLTAGFFIQQEAVRCIHYHTPASPPQPRSSIPFIIFLLLILLNGLQRKEHLGLVLIQFCRAAEEPQCLNPNKRQHSRAEQDRGRASVRRWRNK